MPALDNRFGWSVVPLPVVTAGDTLVAIGFYFIFLVYKENTFAAATIEVAKNQKVISTGPYALVACRRDNVTADAAGRIGIFPPDRLSVR